MKILKRSITLLVCLILLTSCKQRFVLKDATSSGNVETKEGILYYKETLFTGEMLVNYDNGKLMMSINFKDGKKDGLGKHWYENGQLKKEENYKDGKADGLTKYWYENGQLKSEENYKDGVINGLIINYYENGNISYEGSEKNGNLEGTHKFYYENGQLEMKGTIKDGKAISASVEEYNENGQLIHKPAQNSTLNYSNSYTSTNTSNSSYQKTETNCPNCHKKYRFKIWNGYGWKYKEETKIGSVKCSGCPSYGYTEHLNSTTNTTTKKECYVNRCNNGWIQCSKCYGKGTL